MAVMMNKRRKKVDGYNLTRIESYYQIIESGGWIHT